MRDPRASILDKDPFDEINEGVRPFNPNKRQTTVRDAPLFQRFWDISMNQPPPDIEGIYGILVKQKSNICC